MKTMSFTINRTMELRSSRKYATMKYQTSYFLFAVYCYANFNQTSFNQTAWESSDRATFTLYSTINISNSHKNDEFWWKWGFCCEYSIFYLGMQGQEEKVVQNIF